jgi:hypothetical protein
MKCAVCDREYGMTHNCAGEIPTIEMPATIAEEVTPPPSGFSPVHYLREAFRIATWNEDAIRRTSRDSNALFYGIAIWTIANCVPFVAIAAETYSARHPSRALQLLMGLIVILPVAALSALAQIGVCFLLAKWFMAGEGRFLEILRPCFWAPSHLFCSRFPTLASLQPQSLGSACLPWCFRKLTAWSRCRPICFPRPWGSLSACWRLVLSERLDSGRGGGARPISV